MNCVGDHDSMIVSVLDTKAGADGNWGVSIHVINVHQIPQSSVCVL